MNMRLFATMLALALTAGTASASQLDFEPGSINPGAARYQDFDANRTLMENSGPIRRRPWGGDRYNNYRPSQPTYWASIGAGTFDPSNQPGHGLYVSGGAGPVLAEQIDLGLQISVYHRSTGGEEFVRNGTLPGGTQVTTVVNTQSIDTDLVPIMGIVRVRIPVSPQVQPYVGGGIGWEWLTVSGTDSLGDFSNTYDALGAQLFGGVNLKVGDQAGLYGEAVWNSSTPKADFFDPQFGQVVREEANFDGLAFHGGLRFTF
jgi:hypothetical protein